MTGSDCEHVFRFLNRTSSLTKFVRHLQQKLFSGTLEWGSHNRAIEVIHLNLFFYSWLGYKYYRYSSIWSLFFCRIGHQFVKGWEITGNLLILEFWDELAFLLLYLLVLIRGLKWKTSFVLLGLGEWLFWKSPHNIQQSTWDMQCFALS